MKFRSICVAFAVASSGIAGACASGPTLLESVGLDHEREWIKDLPPNVRAIAHKLQEQQPTDEKATPAQTIDTPNPNSAEEKHKRELEEDSKLGKEVAAEVEKELKFSDSSQMISRVRRIGAEFAAIANANKVDVSWGDKRLNPFDYQFFVVKGDDVNAFSLPGGYIYFYEGLVKFAETDYELAGVMAHEVSHASFRHMATLQREQSKLQAVTLPLILISLLSGTEAGQGVAIAGNLTNQAIGSGWSVKAEKAADYGAFQYMRKSGQNVNGLLTFMERLAFEERFQGKVDWGIYRTHPPSRERVNAVLGMMRGASIPIQRSVSSTSLRAVVQENEDKTFTLVVLGRKFVTFSGEGAATRAVKAGEAVSDFLDQVPSMYDVEGRPSGEIIGRGNPLFKLEPQDVVGTDATMGSTVDGVLRELKKVIFDLQYRIWDN